MTYEEANEALLIVQAKLKEQGSVVDDRLLKKERDLKKLIFEYENN